MVKLADPEAEFNPMDEPSQLVLTVWLVQIRLRRHPLLARHDRPSFVTRTFFGAHADAPSLSSRESATMIDRLHSILCMMYNQLAPILTVKSYLQFWFIVGPIDEK